MILILNKCDIIKVGDEIMVKREKKVEMYYEKSIKSFISNASCTSNICNN